jgi:hypothetical protein
MSIKTYWFVRRLGCNHNKCRSCFVITMKITPKNGKFDSFLRSVEYYHRILHSAKIEDQDIFYKCEKFFVISTILQHSTWEKIECLTCGRIPDFQYAQVIFFLTFSLHHNTLSTETKYSGLLWNRWLKNTYFLKIISYMVCTIIWCLSQATVWISNVICSMVWGGGSWFCRYWWNCWTSLLAFFS